MDGETSAHERELPFDAGFWDHQVEAYSLCATICQQSSGQMIGAGTERRP